MRTIPLDAGTAPVLRTLGHGRAYRRDTDALTLLFRRGGGTGLILTSRADDAVVRVWCDSAQWCRWIAPVLPVADWHAVPDELRAALAAWTFACVAPCAAAAGLAWPQAEAVEPEACSITNRWLLRLEREGATLDLQILDAPSTWIAQLAAGLDPLDAPPGDAPGRPAPALRVALIAGWSCIDTTQLARLHRGDALLLHHAYAVADGELGLFTDRPLASVIRRDALGYTIGVTMETFDDWLDVEPADPAATLPLVLPLDASVRIVAQAAAIDVPLDRLAALRPGDILEGPAIGDGLCTLKIGGRPFARGMLLDIDGRLAIRIEHFV
ncbi:MULTISPECIES: type III secretion system cytoplasmic ring protein SctQ [unclassified Burkholderia]|uniref:type III secretion system cytoplasmic ring protein SctQ n=1 Tax=unclassified Burkholderia TaxID=2613784 RepID=UPI00075A250E|nr:MULTISPECIES: type III secretion system cytoplasmic ring protein SctQ [unclassified Burkholderia]KVN03489.1 translocation protein in type III secretion [Burkholderia sp. MSMB1552]KWZ55921.1 translocation protein in type III secretion [Burkholderia sp. MSMB1588]